MRTNVLNIKRGILEVIMYFSKGLILASQIIKNAFNNLFDLDNYKILVIILCNCYVSWEAVINRRQYLKILCLHFKDHTTMMSGWTKSFSGCGLFRRLAIYMRTTETNNSI